MTGLKEKIKDLEYEYRFDQRELGKIMIVASATVFLFSVHSVLTLNPALEEAEQTEDRLSQLDAVIQTQRFNRSLAAIESFVGTGRGEDMRYAARTLRSTETTLRIQDSSYSRLDKTLNTYRWLVLLGLLGMVAGAATIYV